MRPKATLAMFGGGRGDDLDNALRGLRISLALALFTTAFLAGLATALLSRTSG